MEEKIKTVSNVTQLWHSSRLKITDDFEYPPIILKVNDSIIGTLGNFSASTGKAKSKKTFNITAIVASALINDFVLNYASSFPDTKRKILYVDTEQSPFHCQKVLNRIVELAEMSNKIHPENLEFLSLRRFTPEVRIAIIEEAIKNTTNLGLVVLDGVRDLAYDIKALKSGFSGQANDHQLGKINDIGMKIGGLALASYLFTKKATPLTKGMEFVGFASFFASMAIWPKIALQAPAKLSAAQEDPELPLERAA